MRRWAIAGCTAAVVAVLASPAHAAFPGHNGMLAVAPLHGAGIVLVRANGRGQRRICPGTSGCAVVRIPRWSPDGKAIAYSAPYGQGVSIVYADGSCLDCNAFGGTESFEGLTPRGASGPAFTATPGLLTAVAGGSMLTYAVDGLQKGEVASSGVTDAVWSATGELAKVEGGEVLAGRPNHLRSLGKGGGPSWAPRGSDLALAHRGWVTLVGIRHRSIKQLAKGGAPAFSPDGKWIAFIGSGHRLSIVSVRGGRVRRVSGVRGLTVDWQPVQHHPRGCVAPPGSTVVASSPDAVITANLGAVAGDNSSAPVAYMGCLRSSGRERLLARYDTQSSFSTITSGSSFVIAGTRGAFVETVDDPHYGGLTVTVRVFNLATGELSLQLGGEHVTCDVGNSQCGAGEDQLVMNSEGFTAAHTRILQVDPAGDQAQVSEQILARDGSGTHVEDATQTTLPVPENNPPQLTGLRLSGDSLTWNHAGSPRSRQLG